MTEYFKFTIEDNCILLNNEIWAICEDKTSARRVVTALRDLQRGGRRLEKDNERLKSELKIYRNVANCGNCDYHNYDWFDDGDEFELCEKGNDMKYHICEDWEEL